MEKKEKKRFSNKDTKSEEMTKNSIIFSLIIAAIIITDQLIKLIIRKKIQLGEPRVLIDGFLDITRTHNTGAGFGILKGQGWLFIIVAVVVLSVIVYYNKQIRNNRVLPIACGAIAGGTIGNVIDRVVFGYVIDYIDFSFWPTFNLADASLTVGTLMLIAYNYNAHNYSS